MNDEYLRMLNVLSKKIKFTEVDPMVNSSIALKDVQPELERLRQKAVSKVNLKIDFIHIKPRFLFLSFSLIFTRHLDFFSWFLLILHD